MCLIVIDLKLDFDIFVFGDFIPLVILEGIRPSVYNIATAELLCGPYIDKCII